MKAEGVKCLVIFGLKDGEQYDGYLTNDRTGGVTIFPLEEKWSSSSGIRSTWWVIWRAPFAGKNPG